MAAERHRWDPVCPAPTGLVRPVRADPRGVTGPTPGQARGPRWRRTTWGFYVPAGVSDALPEQRVLEQSMRLPRGGAVTGWASARLHGAALLDGLLPDGSTRMPVPLAIGPTGNIRRHPEVSLSRDVLDPAETVVRHGIPCTRPERAVFDAVRTAPGLREAVVALDMALAGRVTSLRRLRAYAAARAGWTGIGQMLVALALGSESSRSPNETRMRLVWELDAALPRPLVNVPVFDLRGRLLGYPDLLDPVAGVVGEFDGADHRGALRHSRDVGREDQFRRHGLEYFAVTGPDLPFRDRVVGRMRATRARARFASPCERAWTLEAPHWWRYEPTLDERLDRRDRLRTEQAGQPHVG